MTTADSLVNSACSFCSEFSGDDQLDLFKRYCPDSRYSTRVLIDRGDLVVVPSIGPLVDGHMLICTRFHHVSIGAYLQACGEDGPLRELLDHVRAELRVLYGQESVLFEHGSSLTMCGIGCGEVHAHLHVVPIDVDPVVRLGEHFAWEKCPLTALMQFGKTDAYLFCETVEGEGWVHRVKNPLPSQLLRRVIAGHVGRPGEWDWRSHPRPESVDAAIRRFRELEGARQGDTALGLAAERELDLATGRAEEDRS